MIEDKQRWNRRHIDRPMRDVVEPIVEQYIDMARVGSALDIACGMGRNTDFIADRGFSVDAVDFSDYALSHIGDNINKIEVDLDSYDLPIDRYDLVLNINYLNRRLFPQIKESLKSGGVLIFETFIVAHGEFSQPTNPNFLLHKNELLHSFIGLDIIYYEERDSISFRGESCRKASLVAKKGER